MTLSPLTWTRLEKAALDNGFDVEGARIGAWRTFASSQTSLRIWLTGTDDARFVVALSRRDVFAALDAPGTSSTHPLPPGATAARSTGDVAELHHMLRRAFQLSRALPDEPLQAFLKATRALPNTTEAERLVVQRVGQDVFRRGLLDYWEGRCAVTGLAVVELLRASHIKPWADCVTDAERLDVFNGLLLAPHLDAAFDRGFVTVGDDGDVVVSDALDTTARAVLRLDAPLRVRAVHDGHRGYLAWHRERVFRRPGGAA